MKNFLDRVIAVLIGTGLVLTTFIFVGGKITSEEVEVASLALIALVAVSLVELTVSSLVLVMERGSRGMLAVRRYLLAGGWMCSQVMVSLAAIHFGRLAAVIALCVSISFIKQFTNIEGLLELAEEVEREFEQKSS